MSSRYTFGSDYEPEPPGECSYFVERVEPFPGYIDITIFCLSPKHKKVSRVDLESTCHNYPIETNREVDTIVYFVIGDQSYPWDTKRNTLSTLPTCQIGAGPNFRPSGPSKVELFTSLEDAKAYADMLRCDDSTMQDGSSSSFPTNGNTSTPFDKAGIHSTFLEADPFDWLFGAKIFRSSPSREDIDQSVDDLVRTNGDLKCTAAGCTHSAQSPYALKRHLYNHYQINPYMCRWCGISIMNDASQRRHMKNVHTCPGCGDVGPIHSINDHMRVCGPLYDLNRGSPVGNSIKLKPSTLSKRGSPDLPVQPIVWGRRKRLSRPRGAERSNNS